MNIVLIIILLVIIVILIWALLGGKGDLTEKDGETREEEVTLRRRASDKEIEKEFPDGRLQPRRRSSDLSEEEQPGEPDKPYKLPYLADEIIPETSRFRIYRRTLTNSEIYATKGDYSTAISLYEGVRSRIHDVDTRFKIDANIEYLKHYKKRKEDHAKKKDEQAKKGIAGEERQPGMPSEIKITFDGSIPNSINIPSLPENIQIGVINPDASFDMETIATAVANRVRGEIGDVREELNRMKSLTPAGAAAMQTQLFSELSGLRDRIEKLDSIKELSGSDMAALKEIADMTGIRERKGLPMPHEAVSSGALSPGHASSSTPASSSTASAAAAQQALSQSMAGLSDLKSELHDLTSTIKEIAESRIAEADTIPSLPEARFDSGKQAQGRQTQTIRDLMDRVARQSAELKSLKEPDEGRAFDSAGTASIGSGVSAASGEGRASDGAGIAAAGTGGAAAPGATTAEKTVTKHGEEEEADDFELLKEYGQEKQIDEMSDEEIFEKILKEDEKSRDKDDFEIIGEKKERHDELFSTPDEMHTQQREDETFYRRLLSTTKRKKKELPILKVSYDFTKLPDEIGLSREKNIIEYAFYKYKPMLEKANEFIKKRKVRDAINYYKVVMAQNIPPEFRSMIRKNLNDLNEYLEKYLSGD